MTRVAYLITHYPSPSHTFIYGEIRALEQRGVSVSPISVNQVGVGEILSELDDAEAKRTFYVKAQNRVSVMRRVASFAVRRPSALWSGLRLAASTSSWDLRALLWHVFYLVEAIVVLHRCEMVGATHIHSHFGGAPSTVAMYASVLSIRNGRRMVPWSVTIHGFHEFTQERASLLKAKTKDAAFVVAISDFTRSQLMRIVEDPALWPKIHVVRCGIDLDQFAFAPHPIADPVRIVSIARVVAEKGFGVLFDAFAELVASGVHAELVLIGDGPARAELEQRIANLQLRDRVQWLGWQPPTEVRRLLGTADVFCLPSFGEGLPIVIMEAMAVGVPVVGTYLGGIPELVESGVTGLLVPAGSAEALTKALQSMSTPSAERDAMVKAARHRVEEFHEMHRSAEQLHSLLSEVAA